MNDWMIIGAIVAFVFVMWFIYKVVLGGEGEPLKVVGNGQN